MNLSFLYDVLDGWVVLTWQLWATPNERGYARSRVRVHSVMIDGERCRSIYLTVCVWVSCRLLEWERTRGWRHLQPQTGQSPTSIWYLPTASISESHTHDCITWTLTHAYLPACIKIILDSKAKIYLSSPPQSILILKIIADLACREW